MDVDSTPLAKASRLGRAFCRAHERWGWWRRYGHPDFALQHFLEDLEKVAERLTKDVEKREGR